MHCGCAMESPVNRSDDSGRVLGFANRTAGPHDPVTTERLARGSAPGASYKCEPVPHLQISCCTSPASSSHVKVSLPFIPILISLYTEHAPTHLPQHTVGLHEGMQAAHVRRRDAVTAGEHHSDIPSRRASLPLRSGAQDCQIAAHSPGKD